MTDKSTLVKENFEVANGYATFGITGVVYDPTDRSVRLYTDDNRIYRTYTVTSDGVKDIYGNFADIAEELYLSHENVVEFDSVKIQSIDVYADGRQIYVPYKESEIDVKTRIVNSTSEDAYVTLNILLGEQVLHSKNIFVSKNDFIDYETHISDIDITKNEKIREELTI